MAFTYFPLDQREGRCSLFAGEAATGHATLNSVFLKKGNSNI